MRGVRDMGRWMIAGWAMVFGGMASAATPADTEAFLDAARRTYPTAGWREGTNTLVTAYPVSGADFADRPSQGGRIRWCAVDGMRNVRDLGGWNGLPTGRAFRGSEPDCQPVEKTGRNLFHNLNVTAEGVRTMRETLGIRTDLDLRAAGECPHPETSSLGVSLVRVPLSAYMGAFANTNLYAKALRVFADANNYPIYFHCWGGADRTGTIAYLLEGLCGVDEVDLAIDYELTSFVGLFGVRRRDRTAQFPQFVAQLKTYPGATMAERIAAYMETTLGLSREEVEHIRRNLSDE